MTKWLDLGALFTPSEKTKLAGIETAATADQTGAEIKTAYEAEANAYTDTKDTKLAGIEPAADVTDATTVAAAGAVMDSDFNANTILAASADDTPNPLTLAANTLLGRGVSGDIDDLDVGAQSFTNLLENGNFESWSGGTAVAPDGWTLNAGTVARSTIHKVGTYSSGHTPIGTANNLTMNVDNYVRYQGRTVTFGCWVYAANAGKANITVADNIGYTNSAYHTGGSTWQWLTATLVVDVAATSLVARLYPDHTAGNTVAYFDGAMLVEGSVCPAFSPKPMSNPSLIAAVPTDTGYNGEVRIYSAGGNRRIYISDGTDWKYVAVAT